MSNPKPAGGRISSLVSAPAALSPSSEAALVTLVDHPLIRVETFAFVVRSFRESQCPIIVARYGERGGHPVLFSREVYRAVCEAPVELGAGAVVRTDRAPACGRFASTIRASWPISTRLRTMPA